MSNVLNLLSEETYIEKMDSQNALLKAIAINAGGGVSLPVTVNSWSTVQELVRLGVSEKVFKIGDQLICNHETFGPLIWDVIGINQDTPANSEYKNSLTIQLHNCLGVDGFLFDAEEPTNPDTRRKEFGSNNWVESNIRQWLNSDGIAGQWWEKKTAYDEKPIYADALDGFIKGLDKEFLSSVGEVKKITANNIVTDGGYSVMTTEKFFLPSITEVYGGANNGIFEGEAYAYYVENSAINHPEITADANRIKFMAGAPWYWWLRSPNVAGSWSTRYVTSDGYISAFGVNEARGIAPCCCIV